MPEPEQLKRGKKSQAVVQEDFRKNSKGGFVAIEEYVSFKGLRKIKSKRGRMDIFIHEDSDDYVTIIEIKATDWDRIKEKNIRRNLYRHYHQLFKYIDKFVEIDHKDVCHGVIYPKPPEKEGLREYIEACAMENYSFPVYWFSEIKTGGEPEPEILPGAARPVFPCIRPPDSIRMKHSINSPGPDSFQGSV